MIKLPVIGLILSFIFRIAVPLLLAFTTGVSMLDIAQPLPSILSWFPLVGDGHFVSPHFLDLWWPLFSLSL